MDRENVIKLLSDCRIKSCAMGLNGAFFTVEVIDSIIILLKEQEDKIRQLELALKIMKGNGIKVDTEGR